MIAAALSTAAGPLEAGEGRLARRLGTGDAVVIGLGSMLGAGVFAAVGPAAAAAGWGLLIGLAVAGAVAYCNATSAAQLAALYPDAGGAYLYGRERLGEVWGFVAGWAFVAGKTASCAALALAFGAYAAPNHERALAVAAVVALAAVNLRGIERTTALTRVIVALVLVALAAVVVASLAGGTAAGAHFSEGSEVSVHGVLQASGLLFFAFAGYARIATLAEEVRRPEVAIPRAIPIALAIALAVYLAVLASALAAVGPAVLADSSAPLREAVDAGSLSALAPVAAVGGALACLGVLLSLLAGVSRTILAMARERELPGALAAVDGRRGVPHRAELAVAAAVLAAVCVGDLGEVIGFSAFAVLVYYAVANASALTLSDHERRWPRALAGAGLLGCAVLALTLPAGTVAAGVGALAGAVLVRAVLRRHVGREAKSTGNGRNMNMVSVRYIVTDVEAAIAFYAGSLGFQVEMHPGPGFAALSRGGLRLLLSTAAGPGGAAQPMPDGRSPEPGGWNRIQLEVDDLDAAVQALTIADARFRNAIVTGRGGRQILVDDPCGNCVELFEPVRG